MSQESKSTNEEEEEKEERGFDINEFECCEIIDNLKLVGINFLAIDFDRTLVSIHTAGRVCTSAMIILT
jgi:hypothetical protein